MNNKSINGKLKGKDLITFGIFSAIYFVIKLAFMLLGFAVLHISKQS